MKMVKPSRLIRLGILLLLLTGSPPAALVLAQTTAFTYQGQLMSGAGNANGSYDMTFAVYDANVAGNFIAGPLTNSTVAVSNGLFTVTLNFGAGVFTGTNYWVEMGVRTNGGGSFATLVPRQQLTPAPYSLYAPLSGYTREASQADNAAYATRAGELSTSSQQFNAFCPPGSVMAYMGTTAPAGWLLCDGSAISRTTYATLFAAINTNCGAGNGSTTFNLPDLRGRFLRGVDAGTGRDPDAAARTTMNPGGNAGNSVGSYQTSRNQDHVHGAGSLGALVFRGGSDAIISTTSSTTGSYPAGSSQRNSSGWASDAGAYTGSPTTRVEGNTAGQSSSSSESRPINVYVNYIIKY